MDLSEKSVSGEGSSTSVSGEGNSNSADDAGNLPPLPHTVVLCKVWDLFFKAYCETNNGVNEGEKKNAGKGEEVGEQTSTQVDQVVNEAASEVHAAGLGDWIEISEKEVKGKDVVVAEDDNEGGDGEEAEVEEKETTEVAAEVAPRRFLDIDLNRSPPPEDDD